ncbi:MAG: 4'-phosphopantetheinyl transferase superfamily protein [Nitrospirae bacterium]|nr:4'-phosphopantetheinyl transferase superfamily protein [Nitrospirota bacterium]MBF0535978.1 4'-phosphopantetheinyl transferase superfamily protein [Nitrospirota bacterium]MBF0617901.1 4'-phosphopantetheinyl transferase superfamily protein [Nitrospirota bacterium]
MNLLPEKDRQNIRRFLRWQDREAALYGRLLLASGIDKFFKDFKLTLHDILINEWGRPFFKDSGIDFNISHTDGCVVCIITDDGRVGIDIEFIKPIDTDGFQKYMDTLQWKEIATDSSCKSFYKYWTMKESVIKAEGRGLSIPLSDVKTEKQGEAILYGYKWYLTEVFIDSRYICYAATDFSIGDGIRIYSINCVKCEITLNGNIQF